MMYVLALVSYLLIGVLMATGDLLKELGAERPTPIEVKTLWLMAWVLAWPLVVFALNCIRFWVLPLASFLCRWKEKHHGERP